MGWLYMESLGGFAGPRQYLDAQFTYERPGERTRVLRSALVAMHTYYAAVEIVRASGERAVIALVCLVRYTPRGRDGHVFGYKDMDESVGPCEAACPAGILDLLTPTDSAYANDWHERDRAHAAWRAARPKLRDGQVVVFDPPVTFTDGACHARLRVVIDPRRPRAVRFRVTDGSGGLYRISGLARLNVHVEGEAPARPGSPPGEGPGVRRNGRAPLFPASAPEGEVGWDGR